MRYEKQGQIVGLGMTFEALIPKLADPPIGSWREPGLDGLHPFHIRAIQRRAEQISTGPLVPSQEEGIAPHQAILASSEDTPTDDPAPALGDEQEEGRQVRAAEIAPM